MSDLESVETKQRVDAAALIRAEIAVASSLAMQVRHFLEMGIVPPEEVSKFEVARDDASRARDSFSGEFVLVLIAYTLAVFMRMVIGMGAGTPSWEWTTAGFTLTATHPDRTGGLGFIGWGQASFAFLLNGHFGGLFGGHGGRDSAQRRIAR